MSQTLDTGGDSTVTFDLAGRLEKVASIGSKLFFIITGLVFLGGYLVFNTNLYEYGFTGMGVFSQWYIVAGIIAFLPVLILILILFALDNIYQATEMTFRQYFVCTVLCSFLVSVIILLVISERGLWIVLVKLGTIGVLMWCLSMYTCIIIEEVPDYMVKMDSTPYILGLIFIVLVVIYSTGFGVAVYGNIPAYLGGGSPSPVEIRLKNSAGHIEARLMLLEDSAAWILVDGRPIVLDREGIDMVLFETPKREGGWFDRRFNTRWRIDRVER